MYGNARSGMGSVAKGFRGGLVAPLPPREGYIVPRIHLDTETSYGLQYKRLIGGFMITKGVIDFMSS